MKEMKDYIHLYIGCKVVSDRVYHLVGVTKSEVEPGKWLAICDPDPEDLADSFLELYAEEIKLILRPLSSMKDEEQRVYGQLGDYDFNKMHDAKDIFLVDKMAADQVRYALSKGFDLFNLKEAGLAVYEE